MKQHRVEIDTSKCIGCGICARVCPAHSIEIKDKKAATLLDDCLMCGQCSAVWFHYRAIISEELTTRKSAA